jgi:hypothetical protein
MTTFAPANSSGAGVMKSIHCSWPGGPSQWKKAAGTGAPRTRRWGEVEDRYADDVLTDILQQSRDGANRNGPGVGRNAEVTPR